MSKISKVFARQILDSRSFPTIEVSVTLDNGLTAYSSAPSGGVINKAEAMELRDHVSSEYFGLGVSKAIQFVNTEINQRLAGMDPLYQNQIDQALVDLDGTPNKSRLGGNSTLATSQAVMKVAALSLNLPLFVYIKEKYRLVQDFRVPTPIFNLINGGRHGSGSLDFQEFQVVPASHLPYRQALRIGVEIFLALEKVLEQKGAIRAVGLEGGFSPNLATNTDALEILFEACKGTAYTLSKDAFLGIDASPQNFAKGGRFIIKDKNEPMTSRQLIAFYQELHSQFRVFAFEDALLPDAWADWKLLTSELGSTAMIMADDLIASNKTLLLKAIEEKSCNALVIKPNRAGTVTETVEVISLAKQAHWHTILSHRSGETNDDFVADLAVGVGTEYVKFGATSRGERVEKYNRLLRIQELLEEWQSMGAINTPTQPAAPFIPPQVTPLLATPPTAIPMPATLTTAPSEPALEVALAKPTVQATPTDTFTPRPAAEPIAELSNLTTPTPEPLAVMPETSQVHFTEPEPISVDRPTELPATPTEESLPTGEETTVLQTTEPSTDQSVKLELTPDTPHHTEAAPTLVTETTINETDIQQSLNQLVGSLPTSPTSTSDIHTPSPANDAAQNATEFSLRPPTPPTYSA